MHLLSLASFSPSTEQFTAVRGAAIVKWTADPPCRLTLDETDNPSFNERLGTWVFGAKKEVYCFTHSKSPTDFYKTERKKKPTMTALFGRLQLDWKLLSPFQVWKKLCGLQQQHLLPLLLV